MAGRNGGNLIGFGVLVWPAAASRVARGERVAMVDNLLDPLGSTRLIFDLVMV